MYYKDTHENYNYSPRAWLGTYELSIGKKRKHHLGFNYAKSYQGISSGWNAGISYAFSAKIGKFQKIRLGISVDYFQQTLNWDYLSFGDEIDPRYGFVYVIQEVIGGLSTGYTDFDAGLWYEYGPLQIGASMISITQPDEGFLGLSSKPKIIYIHPQYHIVINKDFVLTPFYEAKITYVTTHSPGISFTMWNKWLIGVSYENLNALKLNLAFATKHFRLFTAGGIPTEKELRAISYTAYLETGLRYLFGFKRSENENTDQ